MVAILFIVACGLLWRLGGWDKGGWSGFRDLLIPLLLGLWYAISLKWWMFFLVGGLANVIRMGYGAWDPANDPKASWLASITHDKEGSLIRAIYGAITSFAIGLFPAIYTGHYILFAAYVLGVSALEYFMNKKKLKVEISEPLNGMARACIILLCR